MNRWLDTRRVLIAMVGLGLFALAARGVTDPDLWWHLRTGQLILGNHAVFHADPYSFTRLSGCPMSSSLPSTGFSVGAD
jgi:hypothetical protein